VATNEPVIIHVDPDSDIALSLSSAGDRPAVLEVGGKQFRLKRDDQGIELSSYPGERHDPEKVVAGIRAAAGVWSDIDADAVKEYIYRAREEGSRPSDRQS
jgi:hypothetical protein